MALTRKTVLITGCSAGGIGAALADAFYKKGYHVFATARTTSKISQSLSKSPNVTVLALDVLSSVSIAAAVKSVSAETGGKLDVLVNNSGTSMIFPALDAPIEAGKELFDLNFWAVLAMVQAFAPLLIEAKGCVVNNASVAGVMPFVYQSRSFLPSSDLFQPIWNFLLISFFLGLYSASKAALIAASETWRLEFAPLGVRTITLMTPGVKTTFFDNLKPMTLPKTSHYYGIRDFIRELGDGRLQDDAMSAEEYAVKVIREVESGATGKVWPGRAAMMVRCLNWLLPQIVIVSG
jgi:1-acylglycerone phosphate reductase